MYIQVCKCNTSKYDTIIVRNCAAWIGTIRAIVIERLVSLRQPAAAQSVVSSSRIILATPPLPRPRQPCPPNTTHPLQISSAVTTASAGRSARAPSVSSSKVCFFCPFSSPSPSFPPTRTLFFTTGTNLLNSQTVAIKFVSPHLPRCSLMVSFTVLTQSPHTGTSEGRSPPAER